jgi:serine/alanine adding enzyme
MPTVQIFQDQAEWDRYVESRPDAHNYHRWRWRNVIQETYGHAPFYLGASENGKLQGILPLFSIRSRLFGNSLVSVPFFSYGGVLADSPETESALMGAAAELGEELAARHIELRQGRTLHGSWQSSSSKVTMGMALPPTPEALWSRFSTGHRNKIRKGQKSGFRIEWGGAEAVGDFYGVFAANMRNLGTPVYPKRWFENMCRHSAGEIRFLTLWDGNRVTAAALLSAYRETLELPWSASLPDTRKQYSHYLMYWTFLEWAIANGFGWMDLGRCTRGSGTYEFKRHWICEERPLEWYYWLAPGHSVPQLRPENQRYRMAVQLWKRLPLAIANQLGPRIVRALP